MSHDGSWRRSTWTPPKRFKSSVISKQARRWESTGALFNSRTRAARLPDWHSPRLSRRQLSRLIVFSPLNPEEFTTLGECEIYSALLLKCTYFTHRCAFVPISRLIGLDSGRITGKQEVSVDFRSDGPPVHAWECFKPGSRLTRTVRNKNGWDIQFSSSRALSVETVDGFWMRQADGPSSLGRKGQNVLQ